MNKQLQIAIGKLIGKDYFKLEFGCKFKTKNRMLEYGTHGITISDDISLLDCEKNKHREIKTSMIFFNKEDFEILGTEPPLQDVLLSLGDMWDEIGFTENSELGFYNATYGTKFEYDLTKSLFNQTDEVKQKLLELMS